MSAGVPGGGVRPVRVEFSAEDNVTPPLRQMEEGAERTREIFQRAFADAGRALDRLEQDSAETAARVARHMQQWQDQIRRTRDHYELFANDARAQSEAFRRDLVDAFQGVQQSFGQIGQGIQDFAARASSVSTVGQAFRTMSAEAGQSADGLLAALKTASGGAISELELMRQANQAMMTAGKDMTAELPRLFEIARASSRALGRDFEDTTNRMILGIAKLEPEILDEIGLSVKLTEVFADYAKENNLVADALDRTQQQQALLNRVLEFGDEAIRKAGGSTQTMGEQVQASRALIVDLKDSLVEAAGQVPGLGAALGGLSVASETLSGLSGALLGVNSLLQIGGTAALGWVGAIAAVLAGGLAAWTTYEQHVKASLSESEKAWSDYIAGIRKERQELENFLKEVRRMEEDGDTHTIGGSSGLSREARKRLAAKDAEAGDSEEARWKAMQQAQSAFDGMNQAAREQTEEWKNAKAALGEYITRFRDIEEEPVKLAAIEMSVISFARKWKIDVAEAFRIAGAAEQETLRNIQQDTEKLEKDREKSQKEAARERQRLQREAEQEEKRRQREIEKIQKDAVKERDQALRELNEGRLAAYKEDSEVLGQLITAELGMFDQAKESIIDWSHSSRDAMAEYREALRQTMEAQTAGSGLFDFSLSEFSLSKFGASARAREAVGPRPTPSGHVRAVIETGDQFVQPETSAPLRRAILEYEQLQDKIKGLEEVLGKQPKSVKALEDAFAQANTRLLEANRLTLDSTTALQDQAATIDETLRPLARTTRELDLASTGLQDISGSMSGIVISSDHTVQSLDDLTLSFDVLSQEAVPNFTASLNAAGLALDAFANKAQIERNGRLKDFQNRFNGPTDSFTVAIKQFSDQLNPSMSGNAPAAITSFASFLTTTTAGPGFTGFANWFTSTAGHVNNTLRPSLASLQTDVGTLSTSFTATVAGAGFTNFRNYFSTTLPNAVGVSNNLFKPVVGSLIDTIEDFNTFLFGQPISSSFVNFFVWFQETMPSAVNRLRFFLNDGGDGMPQSLNALKGNFGAFISDSRVTGMQTTMDSLKTAAQTLSDTFSGLGGANSPLERSASLFIILKENADVLKIIFSDLAFNDGGGIIDKLKAKFQNLNNDSALGSIPSKFDLIKSKSSELGNGSSGALPSLNISIDSLIQKIGATGTPGTLNYGLNSLSRVDNQGTMDWVKTASDSWKTATSSLKDDVSTLANSVIQLNNALLSFRLARSSADKVSYPDSRVFGQGPGIQTWEYIFSVMDPSDGYKSRNRLRDTILPRFGGNWRNVAFDLDDWVLRNVGHRDAGMMPSLRPSKGGSSGVSVQMGGSSGSFGSGGGIVINVNVDARGSSFESKRAAERVADQISKQIASKLKSRPTAGRLTGGI